MGLLGPVVLLVYVWGAERGRQVRKSGIVSGMHLCNWDPSPLDCSLPMPFPTSPMNLPLHHFTWTSGGSRWVRYTRDTAGDFCQCCPRRLVGHYILQVSLPCHAMPLWCLLAMITRERSGLHGQVRCLAKPGTSTTLWGCYCSLHAMMAFMLMMTFMWMALDRIGP